MMTMEILCMTALYSIGEKVKILVLQDDFNMNFDGAKEYEYGYYRMVYQLRPSLWKSCLRYAP